MQATPVQYAAAAKAIHALANKMVAALPWYEKAAAENALNDALVNQFAKAAVDAAMSAAPASGST